MYNEKTSFNYWVQDRVSAVSQKLQTEISLFVEENEFNQYPSIVVAYPEEDLYDFAMYQYYSIIEMNLFILKSDTRTLELIKKHMYLEMGFNRANYQQYVEVPKLNYEASVSDPVFMENMRLYHADSGWEKIGDIDNEVRHYQKVWFLSYKMDHS